MTSETIGSLTERISHLEGQFRDALRNKFSTHSIELETAENVMARVRKWTTLILYFAGIPVVIALLTMAFIFGKDTFEIRHIAANAQASINQVLTQAQQEATNAKKTADDASAKAKQVDSEIAATGQSVSKLQSEVDARSADVQKLSSQLDASQQHLTALIAKANSQEAQFAKMTQQVQALQTARAVAEVQSVYPIYGQHIAQGPKGIYIDPKSKPADAIYLDLNLSLSATPSVSDTKVGEAVSTLSNDKITVMIGTVYTVARAPNGSAQAIGIGFDTGSCQNWAHLDPPCVLYFLPAMKGTALKARDIMKAAQAVPDNHVVLIDPSKLSPQQRELVELSAVDIVVVLGQ